MKNYNVSDEPVTEVAVDINDIKDNFEYVYDEDGNEHEIAHITEDMLKSFDAEYEKYKKEHVPKAKEITSKVDSLLNVMRADLGNEAYIRK